jgi:hypothetical protein
MTHLLVVEVRTALKKAANAAQATHMQTYMKSAMPYRGVPAPLRALWRPVFPAQPLSSAAAWQAVALARWLEERYAAIALTDLPRYDLLYPCIEPN